MGKRSIALIDVGGQRSERKKWFHCFEGVNAVLFVVAMSEYDQPLKENKDVNRMQESIKLFASICDVIWFAKSAMLLFLNKKDVFDEKMKHSPLTQCFPEHTEGSYDTNAAAHYISEVFVRANKLDREVYRHFTCAKDSQNISVVFHVCIDTIIQNNLKFCGMH